LGVAAVKCPCTNPQGKPVFDERTFQELLLAAYLLQQHNDRLLAKSPGTAYTQVLSNGSVAEYGGVPSVAPLAPETIADPVLSRLRSPLSHLAYRYRTLSKRLRSKSSWYEVTLSDQDIIARKGMALQDEFMAVFRLNGKPKDAALFCNRSAQKNNYYFTPGAARIAAKLISRHAGAECPTPQGLGSLSLLVADDPKWREFLRAKPTS